MSIFKAVLLYIKHFQYVLSFLCEAYNLKRRSNIGILTSLEICVRLGSSLAQTFFQNCHDNTKEVLDLIAPEKSPPPCFTIQIDNKKIASLMHNEIVKANVHDSILGKKNVLEILNLRILFNFNS